MQARGPLMIEHRLIERMIAVIRAALERVQRTNEIDPLFVDVAVDFLHTYADRTHHGKEEDIMFRELKKKNLSDADRRIMNELIEEHEFGRKTTKDLMETNASYRKGNAAVLGTITECLRAFVEFYPRHIEKEDKVFFPAARAYVTEEEDQAMLVEFYEFDRKMIHEKYTLVVQSLER
ncbi:MAG: cation-binding protein [Nitrospirae bacterium]|nr:cation-binding protein [Nitrospirota bacterium]